MRSSTFDPNHFRDFIDVYVAEIKRVEQLGLANSTFHGAHGMANYQSVMLDFFAVRSLSCHHIAGLWA